MLLVIFGAGASFDSVPHLRPPGPTARTRELHAHEHDRPPLANRLFDDRDEFVSAMEKFRDCMPLIPALRRDGIAVEKELAKFQLQAKTFPLRHRQLAAIRYYLHFALWGCQERWYQWHKGITNYLSLLDEIERWRFEQDQRVCIVTFNYDTMLEQAMQQVLRFEFEDLGSYTKSPTYSLIKLHGSINWGREVGGISSPPAISHQSLIDRAADLTITNRYRIVTQAPMLEGPGRVVVFPALSIPVENKDEFSCPEFHVAALRDFLPGVTKIMTIGWRATEKDFLSMLRESVRARHLLVVSGDNKGAAETHTNLMDSGMLPPTFFTVDTGFTGLINNISQVEQFLRRAAD